ncbi:MAG TPA: N-acetylmuramoyl-L-alanine amidase [Verrucomicrobiae bacterium]
MKIAARLFVLALAVGLALSASAQRRAVAPLRAAAPPSPGRGYVRLWDWARLNNFDIRWLQRDKVLELSSHRGSRLVFTAESREAQINGIKVLLSFPLAVGNSVGWISSLDLRAAVQPVLYPLKNPRGAKIKNIVLDPGHGGKDPGYQGRSYQEKKYTLLLAQELRDQLLRAGFNVSLTRSTDAFVDLPVRPDLANRRRADLFISLHFNAVESGVNQVSGSQVYCMTPVGASSTNARGAGAEAAASIGNRNDAKNILLAYQLQKSLTRNLGAEDRGVCRGRLAVLRDATMPAVLIEGGYLSHPVEGRKIVDPAYRRQMAKAIVNGVLAYKDLVEQ